MQRYALLHGLSMLAGSSKRGLPPPSYRISYIMAYCESAAVERRGILETDLRSIRTNSNSNSNSSYLLIIN